MVMLSPGGLPTDARLGRALQRVRRRYALRTLVRGLAMTCLAVVLGVVAAALALEGVRYASGFVEAVRMALYAWMLLVGYVFLVQPMLRIRRQASALALARYIEEHEPGFDAALRSAVEGDRPRGDGDGTERSERLQSRLMNDVVDRLESVDLPKQVDETRLRKTTATLGLVLLLCAGFLALAPRFVRQALPFLFDLSRAGRSTTPYSINVEPGNQTIARGGDVEIAARLVGFSGEAELVTRSGSVAWHRSPMTSNGLDGESTHKAMLLSLQSATEYFVESSGNRSAVFRIDVVDRPYVKQIDLEYRLPAYAGVPPQRVEGTGDITTLQGTEVRVSIVSTIPVKAGRLVVQGRESSPIPLEVGTGGTDLKGSLEVTADGFYRVELETHDGSFAAASPDYLIEAVTDLPPRVAFARPGRDTQATPIEEVFIEAKAEDDFGVAKLELFYSVNGGAETSIPLHRSPALKEVVTGHTFFLEEMNLKPGDFISYYARATDLGAPGRMAASDIYFLEARPFRKDYRQAEQGGASGSGGGDAAGSLSQQQRQVIAATFRLVREQTEGARDRKAAVQDAQTVAVIQGRLRTQVEQLVTRMASRGALPEGSPMHGTAEELRQAMEKMAVAETELRAPRPKEALSSEQAALGHLQRAEAAFRDVQVSFGGGGGGGGGGQSNSSAEELADLYQLDLDKLKNQYETLRSGAKEQRDQQVDEALARLQELARRQEQENERARQQGARTPNQAGGGGGGSQRQLADEAEELGRKLERLTRENPSPGLEESARRLREAAAEMRRQASSSRGQSGSSSGSSPLDRLREARRLLDNEKSGRLDRDLSGFKEKAQQIKKAQESIAREMRELANGVPESSSSPGAPSRAERTRERKEALASEVADLESHLDKVARDSRREQKDASRKLQEAANGIRDSKLKEKIRYTRGLVDRAAQAEAYEQDIAENIERLSDQIDEASRSMGVAPERRKADALDRARSLAQALDSIGERLRSRGGSGDRAAQERDAAGQRPGSPEDSGKNQGSSNGQNGPGREGQSADGGGGRAGGTAGIGGSGGTSANGGRPGAIGEGGRGALSSEEARQLRRELAQRSDDARDLERALRESGLSSSQAASLAKRLGSIGTDRNFKDPLGLADLTRAVSEDIKMLEYVLRREAEGDRPALQLSGSEELPPGYRAMVEEYYRTLARKPRK